MSSFQALHCVENVQIRQYGDVAIAGLLTLLRKEEKSGTDTSTLFLAWTPFEMLNSQLEYQEHNDIRNETYGMRVPVTQLRALKAVFPKPIGTPFLVLNLRNGLSFPPLFFNEGGIRELIHAFQHNDILLTRSRDDDNTFLIEDTQSLQQSLHKGAAAHQPPDLLDSLSWNVLSTFAQVSKSLNFGSSSRSRSKVDASIPSSAVSTDVVAIPADFRTRQCTEAEVNAQRRRRDRRLASLKRAETRYSTDLGAFEVVENDSKVVGGGSGGSELLSHSFKKERTESTLSRSEWSDAFDDTGMVEPLTERSLRKRIFYGTIDPSIRAQVWPFLFGYVQFSETQTARELHMEKRRARYDELKRQWTSIDDEQAAMHSHFRDTFHRINKDVHRTDRLHAYFVGADDNEHLRELRDILMTYSFFNFDLAYVQGMNDLLSVILIVVQHEADAFWCFVGLMQTMRRYYSHDQAGMNAQLTNTRDVMRVVDPELAAYLEQNGSKEYFCCFRWMLLMFKREFSHESIVRLWDALLSEHLSPNMHIFVAVAMLSLHRAAIIDNKLSFDEVLKYCNELSGTMDVDEVLMEAEAMFRVFITKSHREQVPLELHQRLLLKC